MKKAMHLVLYVTFGLYCLVILSLLFIRSRGYMDELSLVEYIKRFSNFVPFRSINRYINGYVNGTMNLNIPVKNIIGNLLLLLPMGLYLPCFFGKLRTWGKFILSVFIMIFTLEVLQVLLRRGSFDIDDLILNMVGGIIGFGIYKISSRGENYAGDITEI